MAANRLINQKSPYLLQHAHNPVDWYAWGPEAFEKARAEDKLIFLSIGYSTCHWCHVMERESFENEDLAQVLNRSFVPVKVDREERPDIDRIYMTFVQATTGGGGWPMSVWLTPDLKPVFGGTYFPPDSRWGRPGFRQVLEQLALAWQTSRGQIVQSGVDMLDQLRGLVTPDAGGLPDAAVLDSAFYQFRRAFDSRLGGFGGAPKFPRPVSLNLLLRYAHVRKNDEASEMALVTLREMAKGGMYDQLGGGFHRYSVDARWFVPHFEKMLYDQGQLALSYLEAFQLTGDEQYASVLRGILEYVLRDMTDAHGGFYSAEDADSVIDPAHPHEKGEGAFYIWTRDEIEAVLGEPAAEWFCWRYGAEEGGNVQEDPHGEFTGRNILYERFTAQETANRFGVGAEEVHRVFTEATAKLMTARDKRVRPHLDDKVLTAWNGLMISAFAKSGATLGDAKYLAAAERAAEFVLGSMWDGRTLLRRWRDGDAAIPGFLDDYAFFAQALLDLYEATFRDEYVQSAIAITDRMRELFEDTENGGFFSTAADDPSLILRVKEDYDGAEPSGNSIALLNLVRLARMAGREEYAAVAERALRAFSRRISAGPTGLPQMLVAQMYAASAPRQIVLAGDPEALAPMRSVVARRFLPFHTVLWAGSNSLNPELQSMASAEQPTAYVCENFTCNLPTTDIDQFASLLQ